MRIYIMKVGCWFEKYHIVPFKITKRGKNKRSVSCLRNKKKKHLSSEAEIRTFWNCKSCWLVDNNWYLLLIDSGCLGTPRLIIISNSQKVNCQFWPLKQQKHPFSCFRRRVTLFHFKSNCCNWLVFSVTHLFCSFYFEIKKKNKLCEWKTCVWQTRERTALTLPENISTDFALFELIRRHPPVWSFFVVKQTFDSSLQSCSAKAGGENVDPILIIRSSPVLPHLSAAHHSFSASFTSSGDHFNCSISAPFGFWTGGGNTESTRRFTEVTACFHAIFSWSDIEKKKTSRSHWSLIENIAMFPVVQQFSPLHQLF